MNPGKDSPSDVFNNNESVLTPVSTKMLDVAIVDSFPAIVLFFIIAFLEEFPLKFSPAIPPT